MNTTKEASSSRFEQINKDLINNVRGKKYLECLGAYCWMKSNAVFTESFDIAIGAYRRETLYKNEISYSLNYLAKAWSITDDKVSSILEEMEKFDMIKRVRAIKGLTKGIQYVYKVNDKFLFCDNKLAENANKLAENTNQLAETDNQLADFANQLAETDNRLAESSMNNNTNNKTKKEKKKDTNNDAPVCHSETFPASADETNYDKSMTEDEELMKVIDKQYNNDNYDKINTINTTMTKEDEEILSILNDEKNETTMTNQHLLDFENLDDKAYFKKYGKSKPLSYNENKERNNLIYNELYTFSCQLKAAGKSMTDEYIEHFKSHSELNPTDEEINTAIEKLKKANEIKSKVA